MDSTAEAGSVGVMWLGGWPELRLMRNVLSEFRPPEVVPLKSLSPQKVGLSLCGGLACDEGGSGSYFAETGDVT